MAEERLTDDDKDKKYRFRINKDGDEELVIDGDSAEETVEEVEFDFPEDDDSDDSLLTPEQFALKQQKAEEERAARKERAKSLIASAEQDLKAGNFATALDMLEEAEEIDGEKPEIYALRLRIYTQEFTDYSAVSKAADDAVALKNADAPEIKAELKEMSLATLEKELDGERRNFERLNTENEKSKSERAERFGKKKNATLIVMLCFSVPLAVFAVLAIYYSTIMFSSQDGFYLVLTIVFAAISAVLLICWLISVRNFTKAAAKFNLNKKNSSTKLGREVDECESKLSALEDLHSALYD